MHGKLEGGNEWTWYFFINFLEDISPFYGPLIPVFWTSGDVCPGFQGHRASSHLLASSPACNGFLRCIYGVTPLGSRAILIHLLVNKHQ